VGGTDPPAHLLQRVACHSLSSCDAGGSDLGRVGAVAECHWQLTEQEAALTQRWDPTGPLGTIGFFCAKFQKVGM